MICTLMQAGRAVLGIKIITGAPSVLQSMEKNRESKTTKGRAFEHTSILGEA